MPLGKSKILITGANGYLGYEIYNHLKKKYIVEGTSRTKNKKFTHLNFPKHKIEQINFKNIDTVIHLAALDREEVKKNSKHSKKINFSFAYELIKKSKENNVKTIIFFSSINVYGKNLTKEVTEKTHPKPNDEYSVLKFKVEKKLLREKGIQVLILRISNIIGVPKKISKGYEKLFIPDICKSAIKNNKIILKSDGNQFRDFLDINILLKVISKIISSKKKIDQSLILNVSSGIGTQILSVAKKVKKIMKKKFNREITIVKGHKTNENKYKISNKKMVKLLNIKCTYSLEKLILETLKFAKKNG